MQLKKLMIDSKSVWMEFPGCPGFSVEIANLSRKELTGMRKKCISQKFDRKSRQLVEELDEEKFVTSFTKGTVKNWKGLTLEHLETLILIDQGDQDPSTEVEYSDENAEVLVANSSEFDTWLNEVVFDLDNFRTESKGPKPRETGKALPKS